MTSSATLPSRAEEKDYPAILGVSADATSSQVKQRYRKLARAHHPDQGGDEEKFKEITEAYEILSNPQKRRKWEEAREAQKNPWGNWPPDVTLDGHPRYRHEVDDEDILNLLHQFRNLRPQRRVELHLNTLEALEGCEKTLELDGERSTLQLHGGLEDGNELLLDNDTLIRIHVHPHPMYKVEGTNLEVEAAVGYPTLALGGELTVPTPDGPKKIRLRPGTPAGSRVRLKGRGAHLDGRRGDLHVRLKVDVPKHHTEEAAQHLRAYQESLEKP